MKLKHKIALLAKEIGRIEIDVLRLIGAYLVLLWSQIFYRQQIQAAPWQNTEPKG